MTAQPLASPSALLSAYRNGGYDISIYADGTKVRTEVDASLPPVLPEQMDLKLTD